MNKEVIPLTKLVNGQSGEVIAFVAGAGFARRLESMGVRIGKKIKKISGMFLFGPVTVQIGMTQLSIGHGMASKVMLEVEK